MFQCANPDCGFRCPQSPTDRELASCPKCESKGDLIGFDFPKPEATESPHIHNQPEVHVLLDNIRSTFNVGSIFRSADGAGIHKLYLGGYTPTPEHPKLKKTGLGSEWVVAWESVRNGLNLVREMKMNGTQIWSLEKMPESESIFSIRMTSVIYPLLLVIGNERVGIDPEILTISDRIVDIPMAGIKRSLNVANAFCIAAYFFVGMIPRSQ